jgi:hypothetical protein
MTSVPRQSDGAPFATETRFAQLVLREFELRRQPRGAAPVFDMQLLAHERIVGVEHYWTADERDRSTVDHHIKVWVEVQL